MRGKDRKREKWKDTGGKEGRQGKKRKHKEHCYCRTEVRRLGKRSGVKREKGNKRE